MIIRRWTEERLAVMFLSRTRRYRRMAEAAKKDSPQGQLPNNNSSQQDGWEIIGG